ncbi:hypothetical protein JXK06_03570, partial [Patescibacteria group bacterium]|nr:hypothetical protein [Patescibacteria group bacterium]
MPHLNSKFYRYLMFAVGISATITYRLIVVLNHYSALAVQIAWYVGTIGFVWYFAHRFKVENRRDRIITDLELVKKIENKEELSEIERGSLVYVLKGLQTSLSKWNYIAIFVLSSLALIYGFLQD